MSPITQGDFTRTLLQFSQGDENPCPSLFVGLSSFCLQGVKAWAYVNNGTECNEAGLQILLWKYHGLGAWVFKMLHGYVHCWYLNNWLFSQGSHGKAFVLWHWKWKAGQMLTSWWRGPRLLWKGVGGSVLLWGVVSSAPQTNSKSGTRLGVNENLRKNLSQEGNHRLLDPNNKPFQNYIFALHTYTSLDRRYSVSADI